MFLASNYQALQNAEVKFFQKHGGTFTRFYAFWRDNLFERVMRLFVWTDTDPVPPKEIEIRLHLQGHCGVANLKIDDYDSDGQSGLTAFFGNYYGVGKYFDEKPYYMLRCPIWAGGAKVGEECEVISNNSLRNPTIEVVEHYAYLLAHAEVTLGGVLINARDAGGVPVATSTKQLESIKTYQKKLYNGEAGVVTDNGALGVQYAGVSRQTNQNAVDIVEVRQKLLKNFYADIGIRASFDKRSNAVTSEVEADTSMLLLNNSDMLDSRRRGADAVNALFGTNWRVELSPEIQYNINEATATTGATGADGADDMEGGE
jgi:hypothetical protein